MNKLLFLLLIVPFALKAQRSPDFSQWNKADSVKANTALNIKSLSKEEKAVIFYINLARIHPALFESTYLKAYLDSTKERDHYTRSLKSTLKKLPPMTPLQMAGDLDKLAADFAHYMGKKGKEGHYNYKNRMAKVFKKYNGLGENCDYGYQEPLIIVMRLLIDKNVPSLGHRKNILNPSFQYAGVGIRPHKRFRWNCVLEFGGELRK